MGEQVHVAVVHLRRPVCLLTCFVHPLTHVWAAALTILRSKHANICQKLYYYSFGRLQVIKIHDGVIKVYLSYLSSVSNQD